MMKIRGLLFAGGLIFVIAFVIIIYKSYSPVSADDPVKVDKIKDEEIVKEYGTADDFLKQLITPTVDSTVYEKEGRDNFQWGFYKIDSIYSIDSVFDKESNWYEVKATIMLRYNNSNNEEGRSIKLKIIPPSRFEKITDTKIEILEYE